MVELADFEPETGHLHGCSTGGGCSCAGLLYCVAQDADYLAAQVQAPESQGGGLNEREWNDVLAVLPENPETADGWELSLVRRTVERILAARAVPAETLADRVRADEHQRTGWALYNEMVETRNHENLYNQAVIDELKSLLRRACESDAAEDCWFDHHGGCQAHGFLSEPCPYPLIRQYLDPAEQPATRPTHEQVKQAVVDATDAEQPATREDGEGKISESCPRKQATGDAEAKSVESREDGEGR